MNLFIQGSSARHQVEEEISDAVPEVNHSKMGHIPALDGIRGVAILLVLICHFVPPGVNFQQGAPRVIASILERGSIGVDLFFVLSGFLITGILLRAKSSPHYFVNFYGRRALRIFPLYYFVLTLIAIGLFALPSWHQYENLRTHWASYWFYGTNFVIARYGGWEILGEQSIQLGFLWSLAVEEHFYLFWPLIVRYFSERRLIVICLVIMVMAPMMRGLLLYSGESNTAVYVLTYCRMDTLAIGSLLAILVHYKAPAEVLRRFGWIGVVSGLLVGAHFVGYIRFPGFADVPFRIVGYSCVAFMFATFICIALGGGWTNIVMSWRPLRFFGVYSYGIYIYHGVLLQYLLQWFSVRNLSYNAHYVWIGILSHYVLCIGASTLVAVLSFHLVEKYFLKLKRYF